MDATTQRRRQRVRFVAIAAGLAVVGVAGYLGFVAFVGLDRDLGTGIMVLAAATGFAAFFSPCSFPLLLTFLSRRSSESTGAALLSALRVGAGAAALLLIAAVMMASAGTAIASVVEFDSTSGRVFRASIGVVLILFGLRQARLVRFRMHWLDGVAGRAGRVFDPSQVSGRARSDFVYGFGFLLAGFG